MQNDPIKHNSGDDNLFAGYRNNPSVYVDWNGLKILVFPDPNRQFDPQKFNCAGLALRKYEWIELNELRGILRFAEEIKCSDKCKCGQIKFTLWVYNLVHYRSDGKEIDRRDDEFHVVSGQCTSDAFDPLTPSKNGAKPIVPSPGFPPVLYQEPEKWAPNENDKPRAVNDTYYKYEKLKTTCYCMNPDNKWLYKPWSKQ